MGLKSSSLRFSVISRLRIFTTSLEPEWKKVIFHISIDPVQLVDV